MEYKWIKKVMIFGMAMSLLVGIAPIQAFAKKNKGVELFGEESFETEAQTSATEPQSEPPTVTANPTPSGTTAQSYAGAIQPIANMNEPQVSGEYERNGDNYKVTSNAKFLFEGDQCGEIEVAEGAEVHIELNGMEQSTIGGITGAGSVVIDQSSNGRAVITGGVADTVDKFTVNGGTILPGGAIQSRQVFVNGGTIASSVKAETTVQRDVGGSIINLERISIKGAVPDAICTVSDLNGVEYPGDVWTDRNGETALYVEAGTFLSYVLTALTYEESPGVLTAKQHIYEGKKTGIGDAKSTKNAYSVKVGAELNTVYGTAQAMGASVVSITGSGLDVQVPYDPVMTPDDMAWSEKLIVEQINTKGEYRVVQADRKEVPEKYTYTASVEVKDGKGFKHTVEGPVTYTVAKAVLTPEIVVNKDNLNGAQKVTKQYDGTTAVPADVCSLKLHGAIEGDSVTGTAKFAYNDANVPKATRIVIDSVALDGNWDAYYTCSTELQDIVYGEITKAPCPKTPQKIKKSEVEVTHNKIKFQGVAGQEYAYNAEGKSKNDWTALKSNTTCTISNASSDTTYTLYTRIAETDNYEASDEVSTEVETTRKPYTASASGVSISGITDNSSYTVGTKLTLTAKGVEPEDDDYSEGDERYVPYSWKLNNETVWKKAPYTAQITPDKEGTYTIAVKFHKQVYNGKKWVRDKKGDTTKTVTFKATSSGSSSGSTSSSNGSSSSVVRSTTAAKTEDPTDPRRLVILIVVFVISGAVIAMTMRKKKDHK